MNADRLLALYDCVADAPDAVSRLRCFVLDLAVRGKLVEQDLEDEPASELLKRIAAEKARLVEAGEIRTPKPMEVLDEPPFAIPPSWKWTRLGELAELIRGISFPASAKSNEPSDSLLPCLRSGNIQTSTVWDNLIYVPESVVKSANKFVRSGDVLISIANSYALVGKCSIVCAVPYRATFGAFLAAIRFHFVLPEYAKSFLKSDFSSSAFRVGSSQTTNIANITFSTIRRHPFPLPPLSEQYRIVSKVDELMGLCDQLEETRAEREDTRDRLTEASLTRMIAPDTDVPTFRFHARFAVDALPVLTARADQVKNLRQTILNLAVRGKLVEQDPADEPLPCLDRAIPNDLEPPFQVPPNWRWSRLRALGTLKGGGTPSKARVDFWNGRIPWVSPKEMKLDYIARAQMHITEAAIAASAVTVIEPESILFVVRGMILAHSFPVAISRVPLTINQDMKAIILKKPEMAEYLLRALKALKPEMLARVQRSSHGTCRIAGTDYGDFMIPLPPFAEQHRIVVKVDELMALCDRMETGLGTADGTRSRLLESLLHDALGSAPPERSTAGRFEA